MWAHDKEVPQRNDDEHAITLLNDVGIRQRDDSQQEEEWSVKGG
jgi:hypothetical protein